MLVETHGPERHDLALRVGVELRQGLQLFRLDAGQLADFLQRVVGDEFLVFLEAVFLRPAALAGILGGLFARIAGPQPIADILVADAEVDMLA